MSGQLYACVWVAEFPAQALLRLRTDWQTEAVVVLDGRAPQEWVCSLNRLAARVGAVPGMTRLEAESAVGLRLLKRSAESEAAARAVLLECAAKFSPRIEEVYQESSDAAGRGVAGRIGASKSEISGGTACAFVLDITGTERLFGPPKRFAERLREELATAGFRASVAVSTNYDAAQMKAADTRGIVVIPEGEEAEALRKLPVAALGLDEERAGTFALWGIGALGELAALPEAELVARIGPQARRWRALARGAAEHAFQPIEPEFSLEEFCEFESPVEQIDSLLFVGARMIDCLVTRAAGRALALTSIKAEMRLEGGSTHSGVIRPAVASVDKKFLLKLLQLEIGAHPPAAPVVALALRAEAGAQSKVQLGLFAPQMPEPSRLDVTLARLRAMVGEERVGSPVLEDSNRAGGFRMEGFAAGDETGAEMEERSLIALRRVRPPRLVRVQIRGSGIGDQGSAFQDGENWYEVAAAYGPWRTSGCWWAQNTSDGAWDSEEWDVLAAMSDGRSAACLLTCDRTRKTWRLEAFYD